MTKALTYVEIDVPTFVSGSPIGVQTFRFAQATDYLPNSIDAIPSIASVSFNPSTISLGESLGVRASLKIAFMDHKHILGSEPYDQGTFWGKWRGRYGTKLRGANIRLIRGLLGQTIDQMETRHYIVDATDGPTPDAVYTIEAKDVLKLADDDRAQAPNISNGSLAGTINASTTSASLSPTGIGNLEYPASGWISLGGKEVVAFTRANDSLTITRGQFGSVAQSHDAGDRAQLVLRYDGDDVADILYDLLTNYASIPTAYINLADWQAETAAHLGVIYAATLCEATSVKTLCSELIQQAALALWWDDRAQKIRLQVLREISTDADIFGQDRIIEGSLQVKEQPTKRISQIWSYYGQRDPTDAAAKEDGYRAALASVDLTLEDAYGSAAVTKLQCRWIETLSAAERLNGIQLSRFRDPPRNFTFSLMFDELVSLAGGYQFSWWANQDQDGVEIPAKIQITKIERLPDRLNIEAEEMLASGVIVLTHTVILTDDGALRSWTVPASWNSAENSISTIGGGAGGGSPGPFGDGYAGAGAGAFSQIMNLTLTPGASISYRVGTGGAADTNGSDTWFNGASLAASSVGAKGGTTSTSRTAVGQGGLASAGIGTLKTSGGNGGVGNRRSGENGGGGGGGGAGGPNGNGAAGGNGQNDNGSGTGGGGADGGSVGHDTTGGGGSETPGDGGNNRFNFGGGTQSTVTGQEGGGGAGDGGAGAGVGAGGNGEQLFTQTEAPIISAGPGGGGGGGRESSPSNFGGNGGLYGGGAGGGGAGGGGGGTGGKGVIAITWKEAS